MTRFCFVPLLAFFIYTVAADASEPVAVPDATETAPKLTRSTFRLELDGNCAGIFPFRSMRGSAIDPSLLRRPMLGDPWGTYYGGSGLDGIEAVHRDAAGNIYVCGSTRSANGIASPGAHQSVFIGGESDAFIAKFTTDGVRQWATYYGGDADDVMSGIAVDAAGNVYVSGTTSSAANIATPGAHLSTYAGGGGTGKRGDAFLVKFNASGVRQWGTYYGGPGQDGGFDVAVDAGGNAYLVGCTAGGPGIVTPGAHQETYGGYWWDALIVKFNAAGVRQWATYYGGDDEDQAENVAIDAEGNVYITGMTASAVNISSSGAHQESSAGDYEGFVTKFSADGVRQWGTYYGGDSLDWLYDIALDGNANIYVVGRTQSTMNVATPGAFQETLSGRDACIVKFDKNGVRQWGTYYGGSGLEEGYGIAADAAGNVYASGYVLMSTDLFTTSNAAYPVSGPGLGAFLARFSTSGALQLSTYYYAIGRDVEFEPDGKALLVGGTGSSTGIATPGAHQPIKGGGDDGFIVKSDFTALPPLPPSGLQAHAQTCTDIGLVWTDNSSNETSFIIEREQSPGVWTTTATAPLNTTAATVSGLLPSTSYSFRVLAERMGAKSTASNIASATTLHFPAPTELRAVSVAARSVDLAWSSNTPFATRYIIEHKTGASLWLARDTVPGPSNTATIQGLQPSTEYSFRVRGMRGIAFTDYSNVLDQRTKKHLAAPAAFQAAVLTATQARLSWTDNATGETGYEIEQRSTWGAWTLVTTETAGATAYTRAGLTPDSSYWFRVRAVGDDAASDWSDEKMVVMTFRPDAPASLTATTIDYRSIRLVWTRGSHNESAFEVERREGNSSWTAARSTGRGDTAVTDDGLADMTTYTYRVRAINAAGASDWSNEAGATTGALPKPGRPFGFAATATGTTSVQLAWLSPEPSMASRFEIEESLTGNDADYTRISPDAAADARSYERRGRKPSTTYWYRVRAWNKSGVSEYSLPDSATTFEAPQLPPPTPSSLTARAAGVSAIQLDWTISDSAFVESFVLERSPTSNAADFNALAPDPAGSDRARQDTGLAMNTTWYYRIKAVNRYGASAWSNPASATTKNIVITPAMLAAMDAKDSLIRVLESLVPEGNADMSTLRGILGDAARGYDETAAKSLIAAINTNGSTEPAVCAEAMRRYTLAERVLYDVYATDASFPGVKEMSREAVLAPALCAKNLAALSILWKEERPKIPAVWINRYDAVMEDLAYAVHEGERVLASLGGMNSGTARLYAGSVRSRGDVEHLASPLLPSIIAAYQDRFLGSVYIPSTQFVIDEYAPLAAGLNVTGAYDSAHAKVYHRIENVKSQTIALKSGFTVYAGSISDLDAAYAISTSGNVDVGPFLRKMMNLRPRLFDNARRAISGAAVPVTRAAYLSSPSEFAGIASLPSELRSAAAAAFDPVTHSLAKETNILRHLAKDGVPQRTLEQAVIDADRAALLILRAKVLEKDTVYIARNFEGLRVSGRGAVAELGRRMRPIEGIMPAGLLSDQNLLNAALDAVAMTHRARVLRTVLSTALADYLTDRADMKNAPLVTEIDTILGYYDQAVNALAAVLPTLSSIIAEPVLSLENAALLPLLPSSARQYRLLFTMANTGGAAAAGGKAHFVPLNAGVVITSPDTCVLGDLAKAVSKTDSIEVRIPEGYTSVMFGVEMTHEGKRVFTDQIAMAVPADPATNVEDRQALLHSITLGQNYPNPFNPSTTISYTIPRPMAVHLVITNALGMEVERLVNGAHVPAGSHHAHFNAAALPDGVYIYRLEADGAVVARKMVLIK